MKSIFVGNLPFSATEQEISELFARHGVVHSVRIINDRETGRPRGFAFVKMEDDDVTNAVAALNESSFSGRSIRVSEAEDRPPADRGARPAFGGGGSKPGGEVRPPAGGGAPKPAGGERPSTKEKSFSDKSDKSGKSYSDKPDRNAPKKRDLHRENRRYTQDEEWD